MNSKYNKITSNGVNQFFLSICIPSYNRPAELKRLLESVDTKHIDNVQIVICEDRAPKRLEVRGVVEEFIGRTKYNIKYLENPENYGHGRNLRECILQADGEYVMFMGDDDMFIPQAFDTFYAFVHGNSHLGYILRSYAEMDTNNNIQYFKYFDSDQFFEPGLDTYVQLFSKSVSMSGFTIKREYVNAFTLDIFDETLLYQLYLVAEVSLNYPSAYCNTPFTYVKSDGGTYFGVNEKESDKYIVGKKVSDNINFIIGRYQITDYIDAKYKISSTQPIKIDTSKYCFYILAESRKYGIGHFLRQRKQFIEAELDTTIYFYLYYYALLIVGRDVCISIIKLIKNIVGRRLHL